MGDNVLYVHEGNVLGKIENDYHHKRKELKEFYENKYLIMRKSIDSIDFSSQELSTKDYGGASVRKCFEDAAVIFDQYFTEIRDFSKSNGITAQSKFASTYYEEISSYLFRDLPEIKNQKLGIYNHKIYAGMKVDSRFQISIITKDVDFCIAKKVPVIFGTQKSIDVIVPVVAVEIKTYLDATMFGEVKSSGGAIRSACPQSRVYVLMGYKDLKFEHIIAARQDATLSEMFALRKDKKNGTPIEPFVLQQYYDEIVLAIKKATSKDVEVKYGRLLFPT